MADPIPALMGIAELAAAINATLFSFYTAEASLGAASFSSVSHDSRSVEAGALFVALVGELVDGHGYVRAAFERGARAALVNRAALQDAPLALMDTACFFHAALLAVDDTLSAFQDAARAYLAKFPRLLKIGITGSSGKTTTKEIAAAMIGQEKAVVMNEGNFNSETGLPLSVFKVRSHHEVGIFEMGMNRRGEIAELARVLQPDIALITNIGSAHIGLLGSRQEIALEKREIFSMFSGKELALIPGDDEYAGFLADGARVSDTVKVSDTAKVSDTVKVSDTAKCLTPQASDTASKVSDTASKVSDTVLKVSDTIFYSENTFPELGSVRDLGLDGTEITWNGEPVRFALPGRHNVKNAIAAAAIAKAVPVSDTAIRRGLAALTPLFGRSEILRGPITVIRDCYNANPESMEEAISFCDHVEWPGRRVYVIGSMLELGEASREAHERLGTMLAESRADLLFLFGRETEDTARVLATRKVSCVHTDNIETLSAKIANLREGDLVLLKGSRGCSLERLCSVLGH